MKSFLIISLLSIVSFAASAGITIAKAAAVLKVVPKGGGAFELQDANNKFAHAGNGVCNAVDCSFHASVMNGSLDLWETWTVTPDGFQLSKGYQVFKGLKHTYEGRFPRLP